MFNDLVFLCLVSCFLGFGSSAGSFDWVSQGGNIYNNRRVDGGSVSSSSISLSTPSFKLPSNASVSATPALNDDIILFPTWDGWVQAYDKSTGNLKWKKNIDADYYNGTAPGVTSRNTPILWGKKYAILGTQGRADILVFRLSDGNLFWKMTLDTFPYAIITQSGQILDDVLYVGISSSEENVAIVPSYPCCSFAGSFKAIDLNGMSVLWSWRSIPLSQTGPSKWAGAAFWGSTPPIDKDTGYIYVSTGNPYKSPQDWRDCVASVAPDDIESLCTQVMYPDVWFNSVVILDINTGNLVKGRRLGGYDTWSGACVVLGPGNTTNPNCPSTPGADVDFGQAPILVKKRFCACGSKPYNGERDGDSDSDREETMGYCKRSGKHEKCHCNQRGTKKAVIYIGQKSGFMYNLDGSDLSTIWLNVAVPSSPFGGFEWGISSSPGRIIGGHSNALASDWTLLNGTKVKCGGWLSFDDLNGTIQWQTVNPACYDPTGPPGDPLSNGRSTSAWGIGPPTCIKGGVLVGSADTVIGPPMGSFPIDLYGDGSAVVNYGSAPAAPGQGGWVYLLNISTGRIESSYQTGSTIQGGFSVDDKCAWIGSGYKPLLIPTSGGTTVFGFCANRTKSSFFYRDS